MRGMSSILFPFRNEFNLVNSIIHENAKILLYIRDVIIHATCSKSVYRF